MPRRAFMRELVRFQDKREASAEKHALGSATHTPDTLANLNTKISDADLTDMHITIDEHTSSGYTLVLTDDHKQIDMNSTAAQTLTIPSSSSVAFVTGAQILFRQKGSGAVTVAASTGVTLQGADSAVQTRVQHSIGGLIKVGSATWLIFGDLTT